MSDMGTYPIESAAVKGVQAEIPRLLEKIEAAISELEMTFAGHTDHLNPVLSFDADMENVRAVDPSPTYQSVLANTLDGYLDRINSLRRRVAAVNDRVQL